MKIGNQVSQSTFGSLKFISTGVPMLLKASKTTLILLICMGLAISLGCKSVDFGKPKLPTLPKLPSLAFWKGDSESELPPPPARHFDPSRFDGDVETQIASQGSSTRSNLDGSGSRINDSVAGVNELASRGNDLLKNGVEKLAAQPIRKPYKLDDIDGDEVPAKAENQFSLNLSNLKNQVNEAKSSASNQLSNAQQDFRSAMKSAAEFQAAGESVAKPKNLFAGDDNSFPAASVNKAFGTAKSSGEIAGGSFSPAPDPFANVKQASPNAAVAGNNSFLAPQKPEKLESSTLESGVPKANDQLSALAGVSKRTEKLINQPFPKIAGGKSFTPKNYGQEINKNVRQPALQPNNNTLLTINKPNSIGTFSPGTTNNDAIAKMRSEVEEAKRQIALLKAQVAAAKKTTATQPSPRIAQNDIEGFVLPLERVNPFDPKAGSPVVNRSQGQSYSPGISQPQAPMAPQHNSNSGHGSDSFYPSTPYNGFGNTKNEQGTVGRVGFDSANEFQNQASHANIEMPVTNQSPEIHRASRIGDTVTEVLIPPSILSGSSSFTPGSTTPLRQTQ